VNHPLAADCGWRHRLPARPPLAEVWHSSWLTRQWSGPLAWWQAWGTHVTPVGGSDRHGPADGAGPGRPTTWVAVDEAARSPDELVEAVLDGMRAGRTGPGHVLMDHDGTVIAIAGAPA
jgi:hypothetical protein